jgi:DNA-binding NarL/FixJ family response regulator
MRGGGIRVLLADDHRLFREGVAALIEQRDGFVLVGEAGDGEAAVEQALVLKPDVAVIDIAMPVMDGIEAARRITRSPLATQSVILSPRPDEASQKQALEAGALGFLAKACSFEDLARAIRDVVRGDYHLTHPAGDLDLETIRRISNGSSWPTDTRPRKLRPCWGSARAPPRPIAPP